MTEEERKNLEFLKKKANLVFKDRVTAIHEVFLPELNIEHYKSRMFTVTDAPHQWNYNGYRLDDGRPWFVVCHRTVFSIN